MLIWMVLRCLENSKFQKLNDENLNIPNILLDSILINAELSNIYNKELLERED